MTTTGKDIKRQATFGVMPETGGGGDNSALLAEIARLQGILNGLAGPALTPDISSTSIIPVNQNSKLDFAFDNVINDLVIIDGHIAQVSDTVEVAQRVKLHLKRLLGEWFLNTTLGMAWFAGLLGGKSVNAIKLAVRNEMSNVYGVSQISDISINFDRGARTVSMSATFTTIFSSQPQQITVSGSQ